MGLLSDYRKKRRERRRKREEAQAEARRELHDAPPVTRQKGTPATPLAGFRRPCIDDLEVGMGLRATTDWGSDGEGEDGSAPAPPSLACAEGREAGETR